MGAARIGRVRMKNGGADVRVLPWKDPGLTGHCLLSAARDAAAGSDVVAFALVALKADGSTFSHCRTDFRANDVMFNTHAFVGMVAEVVRDDLIAWESARQVVNRANGYED